MGISSVKMFSHQGRYARYKAATGVFTSWLKKSAPQVKHPVESSTLFIKEGVNFIVQKGISVPPEIYSSLLTSIDLRRKTMQCLEEKGIQSDDGHQYYLTLLSSVKSMLKPLVEVMEAPSTESFLRNRFEALTVEENPLDAQKQEEKEKFFELTDDKGKFLILEEGSKKAPEFSLARDAGKLNSLAVG
jgi:hypothetical protein